MIHEILPYDPEVIILRAPFSELAHDSPVIHAPQLLEFLTSGKHALQRVTGK